ncbi:2-dehydropantoate 2-reductase [Burkholderia sp. 117]|nr:2-dehydropantoate 2-reductase [Burkholderia sp. 136(2017)]PNX13535.1 2-dehydropantoate 2-reductase [Burkholderia sp. 129]PNX27858.1 2-dehydropantoate 2-reductase [Burkholderia sp. 117]PNX36730.1 2-dehydropantoate 2-reductase [Burkholderia sp. 137]
MSGDVADFVAPGAPPIPRRMQTRPRSPPALGTPAGAPACVTPVRRRRTSRRGGHERRLAASPRIGRRHSKKARPLPDGLSFIDRAASDAAPLSRARPASR